MDLVTIRVATADMAEQALADCHEGAVVTACDEADRSVTATVRVATGMPQRPLSESQLEAKFLACAVPALGRSAARALFEHVRHLDTLQYIKQLMDGRAAAQPE